MDLGAISYSMSIETSGSFNLSDVKHQYTYFVPIMLSIPEHGGNQYVLPM